MWKAISRIVAFGLESMRGPFPKTIRIETTNACNAKCVICPHGEMDRALGVMDDELFLKIVTECAAAGVDTLHLHNFGEPLVDKGLPDRIALCKQLGIRRVKIFSNGSLLTREKAKALIEAGLDEIKISIDGANREEFERIRKPLKYGTVIGNVIGMVELRNEMGSKLRINVTCTATTDRDATMRELESHVDGFSFGKIHNWADWDDEAVAEGRAKKPHRKPCSRVFQTFTILADGRVALCCLDYGGRVVLGDLREEGQSIRSIWNNEAYRQVRTLHTNGRQGDISICANCAKSFW